jgi:hypothetical protein
MHKDNKIKIVSLPRLKRFGIEAQDRYSRRWHRLFNVGRFTEFENHFTHHPDGGEAMYREWFKSQLADYEDLYRVVHRMYHAYHFSDSACVLILLVDEETPPIHAKIIRDFIESAGAKI